jgi:hypothetical protein
MSGPDFGCSADGLSARASYNCNKDLSVKIFFPQFTSGWSPTATIALISAKQFGFAIVRARHRVPKNRKRDCCRRRSASRHLRRPALHTTTHQRTTSCPSLPFRIPQFASMVAYGEPLTDPATWKKESPYFMKAKNPELRKYPGLHARSVETPEGLLIEYDVAVPLRDGVEMYVDIYRPSNASMDKIPIVIAWTPVYPGRVLHY